MNNKVIAWSSVILVSFLGSYFTRSSTKSEWYEKTKPKFTPPSYIFPIVWTILYILLAFALTRVLDSRNKVLIMVFYLNLILNVTWCYLYFYKKNIDYAFVNILLILVTGLAIINLTKDKQVVKLVTPYVLWIIFATVLNYYSRNVSIR